MIASIPSDILQMYSHVRDASLAITEDESSGSARASASYGAACCASKGARSSAVALGWELIVYVSDDGQEYGIVLLHLLFVVRCSDDQS